MGLLQWGSGNIPDLYSIKFIPQLWGEECVNNGSRTEGRRASRGLQGGPGKTRSWPGQWQMDQTNKQEVRLMGSAADWKQGRGKQKGMSKMDALFLAWEISLAPTSLGLFSLIAPSPSIASYKEENPDDGSEGKSSLYQGVCEVMN